MKAARVVYFAIFALGVLGQPTTATTTTATTTSTSKTTNIQAALANNGAFNASGTLVAFNATNFGCDPFLLASYDLEPLRFPTTEKNLVCKGIKDNCCSLFSQQVIYNQWVSSGIRDRLLNTYKDFLSVLSSIFEQFKGVEAFAAKVVKNTASRPQASCRRFGKAVLDLNASGTGAKVLEAAKAAFRLLYDSHRGFYCSLCDGSAHKQIFGTLGRISYSYHFCSNIVQATLPYLAFKHKHFMKIARSLGQLLLSCDEEGFYRRFASLKYDLKFFKNPDFLQKIEQCQQNKDSEAALSFCLDYCAQFNPARLSEFFEGDLARLFTFDAWLKKAQAQGGQPAGAGDEAKKQDLKFEGRLLAEAPKVDYSSEVNSFRQEFNLQVKTGITYSASEDFSSKFQTDFSESLFGFGLKRYYDLSKFSADFAKNGINYLWYGKNSIVGDKTLGLLIQKPAVAAPGAQGATSAAGSASAKVPADTTKSTAPAGTKRRRRKL